MGSPFDRAYAEEQLKRRNSSIRRILKWFYLRNLLRELPGPTIDFGCGAGQLLEQLPAGSSGLEINPFLVSCLRDRGLDVHNYDGFADDFAMTPVEGRSYRSLVCSHVLEHFDDPARVLTALFRGATAREVKTIVVVVPGWRGYLSDPTHRCFITEQFVRERGLSSIGQFKLNRVRYFPLNTPALGKLFVYHETLFRWDAA